MKTAICSSLFFASAFALSILFAPSKPAFAAQVAKKKAKMVEVEPGDIPKPIDGVVELADENLEGLVEQLLVAAPKRKGVDLQVERGDVFTGLEAIKQTGTERHVGQLKGWSFSIVETPKTDNEFRYIRYAWRKEGGGSILIAFATGNGIWNGKRYVAGPYNLGGSGIKVADVAPTEWTVVTRDLFKDMGAMTLSSILFSSAAGGTAYFDHILLGQTIADLDKRTEIALGKQKPKEAMEGKFRDGLWTELMGDDKTKATVAFRSFLSVAPEQVKFIREKLPKPMKNDRTDDIKKWMKQLDDENFERRREATDELLKIGEATIPFLQTEALKDDKPETQYRANYLLKKLGVKGGEQSPAHARAARIVRLLERANTPDAKELLDDLSQGTYGHDYTAEARTALARIKDAK